MFTFLAPLVTLFAVAAAVDVLLCLNTLFQWIYNSLGQTPCEMASYLEGVCSPTGANVDILPLSLDEYYIAGSLEFTNACRCSTVVYSLLSACAVCQISGTFRSWSTYSFNCTNTIKHLSDFPGNIPSGTRIPHWAYLDTLDTFSASTAQDSMDAPESTPVLQATTPPRGSTGLPGPTVPVQDSGSKKSNAGAIAGGVVGGLAVLAIAGGLVFWLLRQRGQKILDQPKTIIAPISTHVNYSPATLYPAFSPLLQKPYDPLDPLTFPTPSSPVSLPYSAGTTSPTSPTTPSATTPTISIQVPLQGPAGFPTTGHGYSGVPEV